MNKEYNPTIEANPENNTYLQEISWREDVVTGIILFVIYLFGGYYIDVIRGYLPGDSISRLVNAWLVTHGTIDKLSSIGFIWPPIPTLMLIPWAYIPSLFQNWMAAVVVSAITMAMSATMIGHIAHICGVSTPWRRIIVFLFAANPLVVVFGINGMSESILMVATLIACYWLIRFWQAGHNTHLIISAAFFGLLPLIRYEFALISAWSGLLVLLIIWEKRHQFTREKFGQYLEGMLLAYSSLVIYPIFLWVIANWFIMGSPIYFLVNSRSATSLAEFQLSGFGIISTPLNSFLITFGAWLRSYPVEILASLALIILAWRKRSNFLGGLVLMPLIVPALQFYLLLRRSNVPLLRYFVMVVPLGFVISLVFLYVFSGAMNRFRWGRASVMVVLILLMLGSNVMSGYELEFYPYQSIESPTWRALTAREIEPNLHVSQAEEIGRILVKTIPPGSKVLMDTYGSGYAIFLGVSDHTIFMDFTDPNYDKALITPQAYVDYVLVPEPNERGALYAINMSQKTLYYDGATWAQLTNILPQTVDGWKLYKVIK